jgi:hypothetical protein
MDNLNEQHIKALDKAYSEFVQPEKLIEYLGSTQEFKEWAELGTPADLRASLIAFEKDGLYEHCVILKEILIEKEKLAQ